MLFTLRTSFCSWIVNWDHNWDMIIRQYKSCFLHYHSSKFYTKRNVGMVLSSFPNMLNTFYVHKTFNVKCGPYTIHAFVSKPCWHDYSICRGIAEGIGRQISQAPGSGEVELWCHSPPPRAFHLEMFWGPDKQHTYKSLGVGEEEGSSWGAHGSGGSGGGRHAWGRTGQTGLLTPGKGKELGSIWREGRRGEEESEAPTGVWTVCWGERGWSFDRGLRRGKARLTIGHNLSPQM